MSAAHEASYVLPLRREQETAAEREELTAYLHGLALLLEVLVVDGSAPHLVEAHAREWVHPIRHLQPDRSTHCTNGKVASVLTGLRAARHRRVVIADDDVRYDPDTLAEVLSRLEGHAVVRPQNYFHPAPWHAVLDTGRSLLNRMVGGDWPGTLAVDRAAVPHGYRGDVLFENLELVRTIRAGGGREAVARDILVRRLPPSSRHYVGQRVRQAYDELARPWRLGAGLAVLPALARPLRRRQWGRLCTAGIGVSLVAEAGRRRDGGTRVFPVAASLLAPLWVLERGVTSWLALGSWLLGGVPYRGERIRHAASSMASLRAAAQRGSRLPAA